MTGTSAPCTSVFKPVWFDAGLPELSPNPTGTYDALTVWWRHENLHREILRDYATRIKVIEAERDRLEADFLIRVEELMAEPREVQAAFTQNCFDEVALNEARWLAAVIDLPIKNRRPLLDQIAWQNFDRKANRTSTHQA